MREGGKKKTLFKPIFGKFNEGDKIKQAKTSKKKHIWKNVFLSPEINVFFRIFFISRNYLFFSEIGKKSMHALARKKTHVFFLVMPKSNARAHL